MYSVHDTDLMVSGFPHSEMSGSQVVATSPNLIAGYHVFHRLWLPRHPPCALHCLCHLTLLLFPSLFILNFDTLIDADIFKLFTLPTTSLITILFTTSVCPFWACLGMYISHKWTHKILYFLHFFCIFSVFWQFIFYIFSVFCLRVNHKPDILFVEIFHYTGLLLHSFFEVKSHFKLVGAAVLWGRVYVTYISYTAMFMTVCKNRAFFREF